MAAAAARSRPARCCLICNTLIVTTNYTSLFARARKNEAKLSEKKLKAELIRDISSVVGQEVAPCEKYCGICNPCLRRVQRVSTIEEEAIRLRDQIKTDFQRTHLKENLSPSSAGPSEAPAPGTPPKALDRKRVALGTPSKFSPTSRPTEKKRTSLFNKYSYVNDAEADMYVEVSSFLSIL